MQYYGIVTLLPNSKYSSPIFAQFLIDLRRVNHLLRNNYSDIDAVHQFGGKQYLQNLIAHKLIIVYKRLTPCQFNSYHSNSLLEQTPTRD